MSGVILRNVHLSYYGKKKRVDVLRGANLRVEEPCLVAITGLSGSGKSSILNCVAGLVKPQAGIVEILGKAHGDRSENEIADLRNSTMGFVFQAYHLLPQMNARDNAALPLRICGLDKKSAQERSRVQLRKFGLSERLLHRPHELSGGEQQRVALARALISDPQIILADEPTGSLDTESADNVIQLLKESCEGRILLLVTHSAQIAQQCDVWYELKHGIISRKE